MNVALQRAARISLMTLIAGSIAMDAGCAAARRRREAQKSTSRELSASEKARYRDPVSASALRERAIDALVNMTSDPSPQIRANALEGLEPVPQRLEPLVARAIKDPNLGVRSTAALMIGRAKLTALSPAARTLLDDPSPFVRASAIFALARCEQPVDQTPLGTMLLTDSQPRVRSHAAFLIGEIGDRSAIPMLKEAAKMNIQKASPTEVRLFQLQVAEALVKLGDDSQTEAIRAAMYPSRPEDLEVVALAVQIIGQVKDRGAIDQLIYLTAYRDPHAGQMPAEVRLGAAASLAMMSLPQGTFIADQYFENPLPALRAQAAFVYGQIGQTENLPRLEKLMADKAEITRVSAAAAVLRAGSSLAQQPDR